MPKSKKNILVIGGGVSGMYAALTAAERGHHVTLCEKSNKLGGLLWFTEIDTHKESLLRYRNSLIARCQDSGVDIRLNTLVTSELINKLNPDAVVCATGSIPIVPNIKGIEYANHVLYAYKHPDEIKDKNIVIIGGGTIGCESGFFFADEWQAKIHIFEARDDICKDSNNSQRTALIPRMEKANIKWTCNCQVCEVNQAGVIVLDEKGNTKQIQADVVLYACGNKADIETIDNLDNVVPWFVVTGDAKKARMVSQATYEGFCAAMDII